MSIRNSQNGEVLRNYSADELKQQANLMRGDNLVALCAAGSGHAGGTLSIIDITAALYLRGADHDPKNPKWPDRDRIIWSTFALPIVVDQVEGAILVDQIKSLDWDCRREYFIAKVIPRCFRKCASISACC